MTQKGVKVGGLNFLLYFMITSKNSKNKLQLANIGIPWLHTYIYYGYDITNSSFIFNYTLIVNKRLIINKIFIANKIIIVNEREREEINISLRPDPHNCVSDPKEKKKQFALFLSFIRGFTTQISFLDLIRHHFFSIKYDPN